jgi:hypothetical protein
MPKMQIGCPDSEMISASIHIIKILAIMNLRNEKSAI